MIEVLIIADDMTGMLDAVAPFANRGISSDAILGEITIEDLNNSNARVVAVTTESRHLSKEQAYEKVYHLVDLAKSAGVSTILKKTDSVLRGHVGAELTAAMQAAGSGSLLFFPAYPEQKRTTRQGVQYLDDIPIAESVFGRDRLDPVRCSYIPEILASETEVEIQVVTRDTNWEQERGKQKIYVFDAASETELHIHMLQAKTQKELKTIAGCAGAAKELAEMMADSKAVQRAVNPSRHIFAVCGSFNEITKNQVRYAAEHGYAYFPIDIGDLTGVNDRNLFDFQKTADEIKEACMKKKSIVIAPAGGYSEVLKIKENLPLSVDIVNRLNSLLMECMDKLDDYTLFHTGGDTLSSFIRLSGCKKIAICGELFPGIAMNKLTFEPYEKYVISKSGGFGDYDILLQCRNQTYEGRKRKKYESKTEIECSISGGNGCNGNYLDVQRLL